VGTDTENDTLSYDVYLGDTILEVTRLQSDVQVLGETYDSVHIIEDVKENCTYYWTVIPNDGNSYGKCSSGIYSFEIELSNTTPPVDPVNETTDEQSDPVPVDPKPEISDLVPTDNNEVDDDVPSVIESPTTLNSSDIEDDNLSMVEDAIPENDDFPVIDEVIEQDQVRDASITTSVPEVYDPINTTIDLDIKENDGNSSSIIPNSILALIIIALSIIISTFVGANKYHRYKFLSWFFAPLYNKLHRKQILENDIRENIYCYIKANPGENYNALKDALSLKNGSLAHHVRVLEREGYVYSDHEGANTRFYPKGAKTAENGSITLKQKLFEIINSRPGLTQHEIVIMLNSSQQIVSYNLNKLVREYKIRYEQLGREKRYYIIADQSKSL
jgi:DNA-binding MarR family transcriptional regulator